MPDPASPPDPHRPAAPADESSVGPAESVSGPSGGPPESVSDLTEGGSGEAFDPVSETFEGASGVAFEPVSGRSEGGSDVIPESISRRSDDGFAGLTDDEAFAAHAAVLAAAIERALPVWVSRCVAQIADAWRPGLGAELGEATAAAGRAAVADAGVAVRALLVSDVDAQAAGPLSILRGAVRYPTSVLADAGVPPVVRDEFAERAFPSDVYGLSPASFADIHPSLHEPGLVWGAAKAHLVLARRRNEGRR